MSPEPLPIIAWKWGERFHDEDIARLKRGFKRHLPLPHRWVVISDDNKTLKRFEREGDQTIPLWGDLHNIGGRCLVRLKCFHPSMAELIGPRFAWCDLDMCPVGDMTPIFSRTEPIIMSGCELPPQPVNGSLLMMDAGVAPEVFDKFDAEEWIRERAKRRYGGSDQAWIAIKLWPNIATWGHEDGLYCYRDSIAPRSAWTYEHRLTAGKPPLPYGSTDGRKPKNACLIQLNGQWKAAKAQRFSPWLWEEWTK